MLSSAFHIETEVPVCSTSVPSTSTPSTSIQDVLKLPEPINLKTKNNTRKLIMESLTSDESLEIYEKKKRKKDKIRKRRKKKTKRLSKNQK